MSFLSIIYSKLGLSSSSSRPKRVEHPGDASWQHPQFTEEIDAETGFVLLTDCESKRCKTVNHDFHERIEHIGVQQAASCPYPGTHQSCLQEELEARGRASLKQADFLTMSDVPFQFSRSLQALYRLSSTETESQTLNMKQYDYDFSLERTVLALKVTCNEDDEDYLTKMKVEQ